MLYWWSNTEGVASIDYTNGALGGISYIDGAASNMYTNGVLDRTVYIGLVTLEGSIYVKLGVAIYSGRWRSVLLTGYMSS